MPTPVSLTEKCSTTSCGVAASARHAKHDLALVGKLDGIPEQIDENLAQASGVASQRVRHGRIDIHDQFEALLVSPQRHGVRRVSDGIAGVEVDRVELEFARLHPGEVQDVVDDGQQRIGGRFDDPQILPLFGRELGVQHEIGHADDAIHRRPNLVTHVRQELALGPVGGLGGVLGRSQVGLRSLALRDVACGSRHELDSAIGAEDGRKNVFVVTSEPGWTV